MTFKKIEFAAIVKLAIAMAGADGVVAENEKKAIALELARFGVSESDLPLLLATAQAMKPTDELLIVNNMNDEQKKYVAAFLGTLMAVDGEIAEDEMKLWRLTSTLCGLPTMNVAEAIQYMTNM
jgi:uncharacterized membrane protein YebE (DUF533 family)